MMNQLILLSIIDFKLIFRDPSLRIFLVMPFLIFAIVLWLMPMLAEQYEGVDEFIPIVLMGATMQTSTMFGFIYSMVMIHEKDIEVAKVYGVMPVSKMGYVASRLFVPFLIATLMTLVLLIWQPFYEIPILPMILLAILCGLMTQVLSLLVTVLSKNKMEGMTWFKLVNLITSIPLLAFFVSKYSFAFGIIPTHWAFQGLNNMIEGEPYWMTLSIGFAFVFLLIFFLLKRFAKTHFA